MADFDAEVLQQDKNRVSRLERNFQHLVNGLHILRTVDAHTCSTSPTQTWPNLSLPQPPPFSGVLSALQTFKLNVKTTLVCVPN